MGCGSASGPSSSPSEGPTAKVNIVAGDVAIASQGKATRPARAGDLLGRNLELLLEPGASATVSLPGGSIIQLGGSAGLEGRPSGGSFFMSSAVTSPSPQVSVSVAGSADITVATGKLMVHTGAATITASAPARFTTVAFAGSHPDVTVQVITGSAFAAGEGGTLTINAGQRALIPAPRGNDPGPTPRLLTPLPSRSP